MCALDPTARDELDRVSQQAKGLWLACQGLKQTLVYGHTSREGPQPLAQDVQPVREAAPMSPYVPLVLASIPEEALSRGVYPEVALKERFAHVEQVCRRVALVDERGGSLFRYLASYLQSLFIVYPKVSCALSIQVAKLEEKVRHLPVCLGCVRVARHRRGH